jgi:hypothetical protein
MNFKFISMFSILLFSTSMFSVSRVWVKKDSLIFMKDEETVCEKHYSVGNTFCFEKKDTKWFRDSLDDKILQSDYLGIDDLDTKLLQNTVCGLTNEWEKFCDTLKLFKNLRILLFDRSEFSLLSDSSLEYFAKTIKYLPNYLELVFVEGTPETRRYFLGKLDRILVLDCVSVSTDNL